MIDSTICLEIRMLQTCGKLGACKSFYVEFCRCKSLPLLDAMLSYKLKSRKKGKNPNSKLEIKL
jgi:hypothetical protein